MARQDQHKKALRETSLKLRVFRDLLLWEASGGMIPLPKGAEGYQVPAIPFSERRAMLDSMTRGMLTDFKVDPNDEASGFELLKGVDRGVKRKSGEDRSGGVPSSPDTDYLGEPAAPPGTEEYVPPEPTEEYEE